jgi:hypothetical protein
LYRCDFLHVQSTMADEAVIGPLEDMLAGIPGMRYPLTRGLIGTAGGLGFAYVAKPGVSFGPDGSARPWALTNGGDGTMFPWWMWGAVPGLILGVFL